MASGAGLGVGVATTAGAGVDSTNGAEVGVIVDVGVESVVVAGVAEDSELVEGEVGACPVPSPCDWFGVGVVPILFTTDAEFELFIPFFSKSASSSVLVMQVFSPD